MPSLEMAKRLSNSKVRNRIVTDGQVKKYNSDMIMEATWWEDISSRIGYLYDWYHDDNKQQLNDLNPLEDPNKIPIDIKFLVNSSQTMSKDPVSYHLQLRPSQECNVPYYDKFFRNRYRTNFPLGMYIDIEDSKGKYNRWLIVANANSNDPQFPTYELLRCDYVFQWVMNGVKYNIAGVLRSQNSYNSGVWLDFKIQSPEDQYKFIVPINRITEQLYYEQRMIIDAPVLSEPRAWIITKINRIAANGLVNITLAQDRFDQFKDYIETNEVGDVIGMWADYYSSSVLEPEEHDENKTAIIAYSGLKPEIKVNGSYKKFTVNFYNEKGETTSEVGQWMFSINGTDATELLTILTPNDSSDLNDNQIKVKFLGDDLYIGEILTVKYVASATAELEVAIVAL